MFLSETPSRYFAFADVFIWSHFVIVASVDEGYVFDSFSWCLSARSPYTNCRLSWRGFARPRKWLDFTSDPNFFVDSVSKSRILCHYEIAAVLYIRQMAATLSPDVWGLWSLLVMDENRHIDASRVVI